MRVKLSDSNPAQRREGDLIARDLPRKRRRATWGGRGQAAAAEGRGPVKWRRRRAGQTPRKGGAVGCPTRAPPPGPTREPAGGGPGTRPPSPLQSWRFFGPDSIVSKRVSFPRSFSVRTITGQARGREPGRGEAAGRRRWGGACHPGPRGHRRLVQGKLRVEGPVAPCELRDGCSRRLSPPFLCFSVNSPLRDQVGDLSVW